MTTRHLLRAAGRCIRAAAPPVLALGALIASRSVLLASPTVSVADGLMLPAWHAAIAVAALWLVTSVGWAATRARHDRRAYQRLQHMRNLGAERNRALVHVTTLLWSTTAGQHAIVVNITTGIPYRVWLPETDVAVGTFVVLERADNGVSIVEVLDAAGVEAAHRRERHYAPQRTAGRRDNPRCRPGDDVAPSALISEIEAFLQGAADNR